MSAQWLKKGCICSFACIWLTSRYVFDSSQYVYLHVLKLKRLGCVLLFADVQVIRRACFIAVTCWLNSLSLQVFVAAYVNEIDNACYWLAQTCTWLFAYLECSFHEIAIRKGKKTFWRLLKKELFQKHGPWSSAWWWPLDVYHYCLNQFGTQSLFLGLEDEAGSLLFFSLLFVVVVKRKLWILNVGWLLHGSKEDECFVSCKRIAVMLAFSRPLHKWNHSALLDDCFSGALHAHLALSWILMKVRTWNCRSR